MCKWRSWVWRKAPRWGRWQGSRMQCDEKEDLSVLNSNSTIWFEKIRLIWINSNNCSVVQDLFSQTNYESELQVAIRSESNKHLNNTVWVTKHTWAGGVGNALWACGDQAVQACMRQPTISKNRWQIRLLLLDSSKLIVNWIRGHVVEIALRRERMEAKSYCRLL